jgi:hypothetical protein
MQIFKLVDEFSKTKPDKYDADAVMELVAQDLTTHDNPKNLASFIYRLKLDNPALHDKLFNKTLPYDHVKKDFEKCFFKVMNPLLYVQVKKGGKLEIKNRSDFINTFENKWCLKMVCYKGEWEEERKQFVPQWLKDSSMRTFDALEFCPPQKVPQTDAYNIFNGFAADKIAVPSSGNVEPMLKHVHVLAGNDDTAMDYLVATCADIIQKPGQLPGIASVFRGKQGCGKNVFLEFFGYKILGKDLAFHTAKPDQDLFGRFQNGRVNKLMIRVNETKGKDTFPNADQLKDMITAPTFNYDAKGINSVTMDNYARMFFTTNNDNPVKIEEIDRRFVVYDCGDDYVGNHEYFEGLIEYCSDPANARAFYEYLKTYDMSGVNLKNRPITDGYKEMKKASVPIEFSFLESMIEKYGKKTKIFTSSGLFEEF